MPLNELRFNEQQNGSLYIEVFPCSEKSQHYIFENLRANAWKNQEKLKFRGRRRNFFFHLVAIGKYVTPAGWIGRIRVNDFGRLALNKPQGKAADISEIDFPKSTSFLVSQEEIRPWEQGWTCNNQQVTLQNVFFFTAI